jgi:hypothetical protein
MRTQRTFFSRGLASVAVMPVALLFAAAGCQDDSLPTGSAPQATAEQPEETAPPRRGGYGSAGSGLGKAKDTAKDTINDVQKRQNDIEDQLNDN